MARNNRTLRAPRGTDEANYGTHRYRVDNNDEIVIPAGEAEGLLSTGGFVDVTPVVTEEYPIGYTAVVNKQDLTASFTYAGVAYTPDANGYIAAPNDALADLESHGFFMVTGADVAAPPEAEADPAEVLAPELGA